MQKILNNIHLFSTFNSSNLTSNLLKSGQLLSTEEYGFLAIDGLMTHFRSEFDFRTELSERQQFVMAFISRLSRFAREYTIVIVVTNQVVGMLDICQSVKPAGGNVLSHSVSTIIQLLGKEGSRVAKLTQSSYLPPKEAAFEIMPLRNNKRGRKVKSFV